jgi:chemotaxis protein histidine kinase CheA
MACTLKRSSPTELEAAPLENSRAAPNTDYKGAWKEGTGMIDTDVMRLRQLRNAALRARALARALNANSLNTNSRNAIFARSAVIFWSIARIATGQLRAHPFLDYQKGPSQIRDLADRAVSALAAQRRGRRFSALALELQRVVREVNDVRALTRLPDLSDSLGRSQQLLRRLAAELDSQVRVELGTNPVTAANAASARSGGGTVNPMAGQDNWPYLAI